MKNKMPNPEMFGLKKEDADRAERIVEMCKGMSEADLTKMQNAANAIKLVRGLSEAVGA